MNSKQKRINRLVCIVLLILLLVGSSEAALLNVLAATPTGSLTCENANLLTITYQATSSNNASANIANNTITLTATAYTEWEGLGITGRSNKNELTISAGTNKHVYMKYSVDNGAEQEWNFDAQDDFVVSVETEKAYKSGSSWLSSWQYPQESQSIAIKEIYQKVGNKVILAGANVAGGTAQITVENNTYTVDSTGSCISGTTNSVAFRELGALTTFSYSVTPATGYVFYGWSVRAEAGNSSVLSSPENIADWVDTVYLSPVFRPADTTGQEIFQTGGKSYYFFDEAINAAQAGDKTVVLIGTGAMHLMNNQRAVVPAGVTFVMPYSKSNSSVRDEGDVYPYGNISLVNRSTSATSATVTSSSGSLNPTPDNYVTYELTVPGGLTVINYGIISIGGEIYSSSGVTGATGGYRSNMILEEGAELKIENTGVLSVFGYILGEGKVSAAGNGAKIYQPFTVMDYRGGGYTVGAAGLSGSSYFGLANQPGESVIDPFWRYSLRNIQATLELGVGATSYGCADLYANKDHRTCKFAVAGAAGLIVLDGADSKAVIEYDASEAVADYPWIGRTNIEIIGSAHYGSVAMALNLLGNDVEIKTENLMFPISYNYSISLNPLLKEDGSVSHGAYAISYPIKLLPGAELTVGQGATLTVNSKFLVQDELDDTTYFTSSDLAKEKTMTNYFLNKEAVKSADVLWKNYFSSVDSAYGYSGNEAFIYHGVALDGTTDCWMTKYGEKVNVTTSSYAADSASTSSSNTKTTITKVVLASDSSIAIYDGLDIVSPAYLVPKAGVERYDHPLYGAVVAEYGTYTDSYKSTLIYKVAVETDNGDGTVTTTYVYKWHRGGYTLGDIHFYRLDGSGSSLVTEATIGKYDSNDYGIVYARYQREGSSSWTAVYASSLYHPYTVTSSQIPAAFITLLNKQYGDGNYSITKMFLPNNSSTPKVFEVTISANAGETVYYYRNSSTVFTEVSVLFDENGCLRKVAYVDSTSGEEKYYLQPVSIRYEFRDANNARKVAEHYSASYSGEIITSGKTYFRCGSTMLTGASPVCGASNNKLLYIQYAVPATTQYVTPYTLFEGVIDSAVRPALQRISLASADYYELIIKGTKYGKVRYEYTDAEGDVCMYYVYVDADTALYVWKDGTYVSATTSGSYVTRVTRTEEEVYLAAAGQIEWLSGKASNASTQKLGTVSNRYPGRSALYDAFGNESANFIVDGKLILASGVQFGGLIQTNGSTGSVVPTIQVDANATLAASGRIGGVGNDAASRLDIYTGSYLFTGANVRTLAATVYDSLSDMTVELERGKTYFGTVAAFDNIPYNYTLYHKENTTTSVSTNMSGSLEGTFKGEWYTANDVYSFKAEYRLDDYIWLNATFKIGSGLSLGSTGTVVDLGNGFTFVNGGDTYYLVRKVLSNELVADLQVDISKLFGKAEGTFVANGAFERVLETFEAPDPEQFEGGAEGEAYKKALLNYENTLKLVDAMLKYGEAAEIYFDENLKSEFNADETQIVPGTITLTGAKDVIMGFSNGAQSGIDVTLETNSAKVYFDEALRMSVFFTPTFPADFDTSKIVKIGLLASPGTYTTTGTLTAANHETMYVLYSPTSPEIPGGSTNYPGEEIKDKVNGFVTDYNKVATVNGRWELCFDLTNKMYNEVYELRPVVIVQDGGNTYYVYGEQVHYSLAAYISRTYSKSTDKAFKNLLMATWDYVVAADAAL